MNCRQHVIEMARMVVLDRHAHKAKCRDVLWLLVPIVGIIFFALIIEGRAE